MFFEIVVILLFCLAVVIAAWWVFGREHSTGSSGVSRRDRLLMNQVGGDVGKYDRLVAYHGSARAASKAIVRDLR